MAWAALLFGDVRLASAWPHLQSYLVAADPGRLDDFWRAAFRGAWPWLSAAGSWPWWATHALVALVGFGLWSWTGSWWNPLLDRPTRATASDVHGSARWRTQAEIERTLRPVRMDAPEAAGVVVGSTSGRAWLTRPEVGNPHTLVVGATRSGKTRRMILPSVWAIGHAGESMVISDPKGELHAMTSAWLRERGYQVVQLDLLRPGRGNRWNPFAAIEAAHASGDDEEAARLAWEFGDVMSSETGIGTDPIWPAAEQSLMAALALGTVLEAPEGFRHPATAFRILYDLGEDGGGRLDAWFAQLGADHPARAAAATAMLAESRTRASIYAGTSARMRLFGEPGVAWLTAQSDHDPADAGRRPMAIFLLLPDEAGARRVIASLYVTSAYSALAKVAREHGGRLPVPVWFLLDEFGNIGKVPGMPEKLTVAAGRGIRFVLAVQSLAQIESLYGPKDAATITGNCDTWVYLRTADLETAQAISRKAGVYTVRSYSTSSQGRGIGAPLNVSESAIGRSLLTPDEVLRWPSGRALILQTGEHAAKLPLGDLSEWPQASQAFAPVWPQGEAQVGATPTWCPEVGVEEAAAELDGAVLPGADAVTFLPVRGAETGSPSTEPSRPNRLRRRKG